MKKYRWLLITLTAFLLMQIVPYGPKVGEPLPVAQFGSADSLLRTKCAGCHGGPVQVAAPLRLAPASWWTAWKIDRARERLNLSEWTLYPASERKHLREQMLEEITSERMPPASFRLFHPTFEVSEAEKASLKAWLEEEP